MEAGRPFVYYCYTCHYLHGSGDKKTACYANSIQSNRTMLDMFAKRRTDRDRRHAALPRGEQINQ